MTILKLALIGSLRIVVMGSLKVALLVYAIFLPDTPFAGTVPEGNGYVGDNASSPRQRATMATSGKWDTMLAAARFSSRDEVERPWRSKV